MKKSLFALYMLLAVNFANAQPFTLDQSFGNHGYVTTGFGFNLNPGGTSAGQIFLLPNGSFYLLQQVGWEAFISRHFANGMLDIGYGDHGYSPHVTALGSNAVLQPDGKVVIGGYIFTTDSSVDFALARFTTGGALDNSFGGDGIVTTNIRNVEGIPSADYLNALALQSDGKIVAGGSSGSSLGNQEEFLLARYLPNGSLDISFATGGIMEVDLGNAATINAVGIKSDGKIVAAGWVVDGSFTRLAVISVNPNGSLDPSFSYDGKEIVYWGAMSEGRALEIQPNGKIVVAAVYSATMEDIDFMVVRMNADGSLDNSFSGDGIQTTNFGSPYEYVEAIALQPDGKIVVAGEINIGGLADFGLARFNTDGSPDNSWEGDGTVITDIRRGQDGISSLAIDAAGKIWAVGFSSDLSLEYAVLRYNTNGSLDDSFDDNGILLGYKPGSPVSFYASAVQADGKIVTVGTALYKPWWTEKLEDEIAVARFNVDGTLDNSFAGNGRVIVDYGTGIGNGTAIAIQPDGKIVVGGYTSNGANQDFALARLNTSGTFDNSFGIGGKILIDFSDSDDLLHGIAIQSDGKIVAAGRTYDWRNQQGINFALCRYNANGTPDNSFSGDGKVITDFSTSQLPATHDEINALLLQPDGKIVVAGLHAWWTSPVDFIVARYNTNGTLDPAFNGTGFITTGIGSVDIVQSAALHSDGKIVVSGYGYGPSGNTAIVRYKTNGTLDSTFHGNGILNASLSDPRSMVLQDDGKIIIGGMSNFVDGPNINLTRYNTDGTLDNSFSGDGMVDVELTGINELMEDLLLHGNRLYIVGRIPDRGEGFIAAVEMDFAPSLIVGDFANTHIGLMAVATEQLNAKEKHRLDVSPNPSNTHFTIIPRMPVATPATLTVFDGSGRLVERKQVVAGQPIRLGSNYKPGIYYVECIQGSTRLRTKLVKS